MKISNSNKLLILKDKFGHPLRMIQTQGSALHLVKNIETKRLELVDADFDYQETHTLLQEISLDKQKESINLKNIGILTMHEVGTHSALDPQPLRDDEPYFPHLIKWSSSANGAVISLLVLFAFLIPNKESKLAERTEALVTIQLEKPEPALPPPPKVSKQKQVPPPLSAKQTVKVVPRTNKKKSLVVANKSVRKTKLHARANPSAPKNFQRLGSLSAISGALKGSRQGMGSGLRSAGGGTGGFGRGAGMGRGNGTMGHGHDSGGGYEQALYGKGLIAGQVGGGGGGFGSGWGEGTRGSGGFGTKGRGGGHEGYGTSKVGTMGVARFTYPVRDEAVVEGGLDREAVDLVVMKNLGQIIYCYELGLQQKSGLRGRVQVDFTINGQGRVSQCSVGSSSLRSAQVESCMLNKIKTWKFPHPVGGVSVDVNYPFALQRVSQN